jgi:cob(I)alamin adenosyltransferase
MFVETFTAIQANFSKVFHTLFGGGECELRLASPDDPLESEIDTLNRDLDPLRSFVLPGGSPASSHLHLARTISRRAERLMVALAARQGESVGDAALRYINRLSDFLFVAARFANDKGKSDVTWVPGKNR